MELSAEERYTPVEFPKTGAPDVKDGLLQVSIRFEEVETHA